MDILLRNVPQKHVERLDAEADRRGISRHALIMRLVADLVKPPTVLGWFRAEQPHGGATCVQCGAQTERSWFAIMSNGELRGPICDSCATPATPATPR